MSGTVSTIADQTAGAAQGFSFAVLLLLIMLAMQPQAVPAAVLLPRQRIECCSMNTKRRRRDRNRMHLVSAGEYFATKTIIYQPRLNHV
jgi:hypothetical protein